MMVPPVLTADQLADFPYTAAIFQHETVRRSVIEHTGCEDEQFGSIVTSIKTDIQEAMPGYASEEHKTVIDALEDGSGDCFDRAITFFAIASQLPELACSLNVSYGHAFASAYSYRTGHGATIDSGNNRVASALRGVFYVYNRRSADTTTGQTLRNELLLDNIKLYGDVPDKKLLLRQWNREGGLYYADTDLVKAERKWQILGQYFGFAAIRLIERINTRAAAKVSQEHAQSVIIPTT